MSGGGWTCSGSDGEDTNPVFPDILLPTMSLVLPEAHQQFQVHMSAICLSYSG
jgi:hypothetical protein